MFLQTGVWCSAYLFNSTSFINFLLLDTLFTTCSAVQLLQPLRLRKAYRHYRSFVSWSGDGVVVVVCICRPCPVADISLGKLRWPKGGLEPTSQPQRWYGDGCWVTEGFSKWHHLALFAEFNKHVIAIWWDVNCRMFIFRTIFAEHVTCCDYERPQHGFAQFAVLVLL